MPTTLFATVFLAAGFAQAGGLAETVATTTDEGERIEFEVVRRSDGTAVRHGKFKAEAEDGTRLVSGEFRDGRKDGRWRWFEDGELSVKGKYRDGVRSGTWEFLFSNGEVRAAGSFRNGHPAGTWNFASDDASGDYGHLEVTWKGGAPRFSGATLDGELQGPWRFWWPSGEPMLDCHFFRGRLVGPRRFYHPGGYLDPKFVTRDGEGHVVLDGFFDEPHVPGEPRTAPYGSSELDALPDVLSALPPLPDLPDDGAARAIEAGTGHEPSDVRRALEELTTIDLADQRQGRRAKELVEGVLASAYGGRSFGWVIDPDPAYEATNRLATLRARAHWVLTYASPLVWSFDLALPASLFGGAPDDMLLSPTLDFTTLLGRKRVLLDPTRDPERLRTAGGNGTTAAHDLALAWIANQQRADGSWESHNPYYRTGVDGLCLLALLGAGNTMLDGPYAEHVRRGVARLVSDRQENDWIGRYGTNAKGGRTLFLGTMTCNSIVAQVLSELVAIHDSTVLRGLAQRSVNFLTRARNPYGAWAYDCPPIGANNTIETGWALQALCAAHSAGLVVEEEAFTGGLAWLSEVTDPNSGRCGYASFGTTGSRYDYNAQFPFETAEGPTAVALLSCTRLGQDPNERQSLTKYADLLRRTPPEWDPEGLGCDFHYWYFGTFGMFQMGGQYWKHWNATMKKCLVDSQTTEGEHRGSWEPVGAWGIAGRAYTTALAALTLQVYWREPQHSSETR